MVDAEPEEREGKEEKVDEVRPPDLLLFCFQTSLLRTLTMDTAQWFSNSWPTTLQGLQPAPGAPHHTVTKR